MKTILTCRSSTDPILFSRPHRPDGEAVPLSFAADVSSPSATGHVGRCGSTTSFIIWYRAGRTASGKLCARLMVPVSNGTLLRSAIGATAREPPVRPSVKRLWLSCPMLRRSMRQIREVLGDTRIDPDLLTAAERLQYEGLAVPQSGSDVGMLACHDLKRNLFEEINPGFRQERWLAAGLI
jgi:hypothetical protein